MNSNLKTRVKKAFLGVAAFGLATAIWLPFLHVFFRKPLADFYQDNGISPKARQLAARHLQLWTEPALRQAELRKMRRSNAEWDFMGRSFLVWSLVNMGLREPQMKKFAALRWIYPAGSHFPDHRRAAGCLEPMRDDE